MTTKDDELEWPCELRQYQASLHVLVSLVECLLSYGTAAIVAIGLLLNILSISILRSQTIKVAHKSTNMYLIALATYDSCVLIFNFMVGVLRAQYPATINKAFQDNEWLCLIHSVIVELFTLLSVWMIICFTTERLIVVYCPLKAHKYCSVRRTKLVIIITSFLVLLLSCHKVFVSGFEGDSVFGYKACLTNRIQFSKIIYFYIAFNTCLPSLIILLLNALICIKLQLASKARAQLSVKETVSRSCTKSQDHHITKTLLLISITYVLLLLPFGVMQMVELWVKTVRHTHPSQNFHEQQSYISYKKLGILLKRIRALFFFFYQFNFGINFFVYICNSKKFRKVVKRNFPGKFCKKRITISITSSQTL